MIQGIVNGTEIVLYLDNQLSVLSKNLSWNVEQKLRDISCREGNGWKNNLAGIRQWSVDCENGVAFNNLTGSPYTSLSNKIAIDDLIKDYIINRQVVNVKITRKGYANNEWRWMGKALITNINIDAPNEDSSSYSFSLSGKDALRLSKLGPAA
jgi:predicted secreted protein